MVFGSEHSFVASCLNILASLLRDTGRPAEAEPLHRRALAIREADVSNQADLATSLHNLAVVLCDTGRFDEAEP